MTNPVIFTANANTPMHPTVYAAVTSGGGSSGGGNVESRIAKLESDVENIKGNVSDIRDDLRHLLYLGAGAFIFLLGAFGYGYVRLDDKMIASESRVIDKLDKIESVLTRDRANEPQRSPIQEQAPPVHQGAGIGNGG